MVEEKQIDRLLQRREAHLASEELWAFCLLYGHYEESSVALDVEFVLLLVVYEEFAYAFLVNLEFA